MAFLETLFKLITVVIIISMIIPLILGIIFFFGHDTKVFAFVMVNASLLGSLNLIALHYIKKSVRGSQK